MNKLKHAIPIIKDIPIKNLSKRKVLLRTDFNVPVGEDDQVDEFEDWRIRATLPTLNYLRQAGAVTIILTHRGRPRGKTDDKLRLLPIYRRLAELLSRPLYCLGYNQAKTWQTDEELKVLMNPVYLIPEKPLSSAKDRFFPQPSDIIGLENIRFHPGERKNETDFRDHLARLGELYINDAFADTHRKHTSIVGLPKVMPKAGGFLLEQEIKSLSKIIHQTRHPLILILGGGKADTKLRLIKNFYKKADQIITGGVIANALLAAKGVAVGASVAEPPSIVKELLKDIALTSPSIHLPVDVVTAAKPDAGATTAVQPVGDIKPHSMILDIGPDTIKLYQDIIASAAMVVWNGPLGYAELEVFASGTKAITDILQKCEAYTVIGGGDTISFLERQRLANKIGYYSTGGGSMLEFLANEDLPGLMALRQ